MLYRVTIQKNYSQAVASAQDRAFVVSSGESELSGREILNSLEKAGFENILLEGGGKLIGLFLKENLIDELYLTVTPWVLGGDSNPSLTSTPDTLSPFRALKLKSCRKVGSELFLHYQFLNR